MIIAQYSERIFKEIRLSLLSAASKYKIKDPSFTVDDWLTETFLIASRFDSGELQKRVSIGNKLLTYDESVHTEDQLLDSVKGYIYSCFRNKLVSASKRRKRFVSASSASSPGYSLIENISGSSVPWASLVAGDVIVEDEMYLDDLLQIVNKDVDLQKRVAVSPEELVFLIFVESLASALVTMRSKWGNIVVVTPESPLFKTDFRQTLTNMVKKRMLLAAKETASPIILNSLCTVCLTPDNSALSKRLARYLFQYHGGIKSRHYSKKDARPANSQTVVDDLA